MTILDWLFYHLSLIDHRITLVLFFLAVISIMLILGLIGRILVKRKIKKMKDLADYLNTDLKTAMFIVLILSNFPLNLMVKILRSRWLKRVIIIGRFPLEKKKIFIVSNHPAWIDQGTLVQFFLSYLEWLKNPDIFPSIGAARDSIVRLPFLKILKAFYILTLIERQKLDKAAETEDELIRILSNGGNLIISGPAGRDFKKKEWEAICSPLKRKPLRKFGGLCGRLSTLDGVITVPVYIEGTERLCEPIDNGKEMKFSWRNFLVRFLLLGKIRIVIVISETPLILGGWKKEKARKKIEETVLNLADKC